MVLNRSILGGLILSLVASVCLISTAAAKETEWVRQKVDFRVSGDSRIKAIYHPKDKPVPMRGRKRKHKKDKSASPQAITSNAHAVIGINEIASPPVDGFVPLVAVLTTDESEELGVMEAEPQSSLIGNLTTNDPEHDYLIGLFDTGASTSIIGYEDSLTIGLTGSYLTPFSILIGGVNDTVDVSVSMPIGLFVDTLGSIGPNGVLLDFSGFVGESNVSVAVGQSPIGNAPDLPTVVGSPMSVYYSTVFDVENPVSIVQDNNEITSPIVGIYDHGDSRIPNYLNILPLELRPLGALSVQYIPNIEEDIFSEYFLAPGTPSIITGVGSQSLFFVPSVDLYEGSNMAYDRDRFMWDSGAQVTVIGNRVASRLALDPYDPDFWVEIQGVTGAITFEPGFYIDSIDIPATGQWLSFTNVPVVLIEIASPEGGTLDGIIGMNLFIEYNFVLKGGGMFLQDDPAIYFEHKDHIIADVSPSSGDGAVNSLDVLAMGRSWLTSPGDQQWNPRCDIAPSPPDGIINYADFAVISNHWLETEN